MMFKLSWTELPVERPRVTPDPAHAAELERRIRELSYVPQNEFHRDRMQDRLGSARLRRASL